MTTQSQRCCIWRLLPHGETILLKCGLALLALGVLNSAAFGQATRRPSAGPLGTLSYEDGDLFIGFRATDTISDYLVNIFKPDQFLNVSRGLTFQVNTGNLLADLRTAFGSDWDTRIDPNTGRNAVLWAVVGGRVVAGGGDPANVLYSTNPSSTPWPRNAQQDATVIAVMGNYFANGFPTANNPNGNIQNAAAVDSYACFQPGGICSGGISFGIWNPTNEGVPNANLYFDRITPGTGPSTSLGYFTLNSSGQLTFHAAAGPPLTNP